MAIGKKLLFFVTEDWYFYSHRLPPARAARAAGYDVVVATRVNQHGSRIVDEGFRLIRIGLSRRSRNPFREILALLEIVRIYRDERPDVVHHVAIKPVLYGTLAARLTGVPGVVNALAGLGLLFSPRANQAGLLRKLVSHAFRRLLNFGRGLLILQNPDDAELMISAHMVPADRVRLIRGSGVDLNRFVRTPEQSGIAVVMLPSRMLWNKGVAEFVDAARLLRSRGVSARFVLVGDGDAENPMAIPTRQLVEWHESGIVEWWGRRDDMPETLAKANIVCLPSAYGEGVPKVLLEAAACGRAIIATDAPGCREIVQDKHTGLLVPVNDETALANAIEKLILDSGLRSSMGDNARRLVEAEFSEDLVARETLAVYTEVLQCNAV